MTRPHTTDGTLGRSSRTRPKKEAGFVNDDEMTDRFYDCDRHTIGFRAKSNGGLSSHNYHMMTTKYKASRLEKTRQPRSKAEEKGLDPYNVAEQLDRRNWHQKTKALSFDVTGGRGRQSGGFHPMASLGMTTEHAGSFGGTVGGSSTFGGSWSGGSGTSGNNPKVMGLSVVSDAPDVIYDTSQKDILTTVISSPINYNRCFGSSTSRSGVCLPKSICKQDGPDPYNQSKINPWMQTTRGKNGRSTFSSSPVPRFVAFGTTSEKGYNKGRNLRSQNLQEQFRFFKDTRKGGFVS